MEEADHDPNLLAAYLEDRLEDGEKQRLLGHLAACADCRGTLALLSRAASAGVLSLPRAPDRPRQGRSWRVPLRTWLPLAASVAIATAIAVRLVPRSPPVTGGPPSAQAASPQPPGVRPTPALPATASSATPPGSPAASPSAAPRRPPAGVVDKSLLAKRGVTRHVAGKTFRWMAGEWVDVDFDPATALPKVSVTGEDERAALVTRIPALTPYAALGERVLVVFEGTVYQFSP